MTAHVLGLDLSVTAPGAVAIPIGWKSDGAYRWKSVESWLGIFKSPKNDDHVAQLQRYQAIADWACRIVGELLQDGHLYCYVEGYAFAKSTNQATRIIESRGIVRHELFKRYGVLLEPVSATSARKLFLGFNPTKKEGYEAKLVVQDNLFNRAKAPKKWDENQADAFVVANYGLSERGGVPLAFEEKVTRKSIFRSKVNASPKRPVRRT